MALPQTAIPLDTIDYRGQQHLSTLFRSIHVGRKFGQCCNHWNFAADLFHLFPEVQSSIDINFELFDGRLNLEPVAANTQGNSLHALLDRNQYGLNFVMARLTPTEIIHDSIS